MPSQQDAPQAPPVVQRFVKQLVVTHKAVLLYPPSSTIPRENAAATVATLRSILQSRPDMRIVVSKDGMYHEGVPLFPGHAGYEGFTHDLYHRNVAEVRFHAGTAESDVLSFLETLKVAPDELSSAGGFEARLWEQQVDGITVKEASVKIVYTEAQSGERPEKQAPPAGEPWPPPAARIDELLVGAFGGRPRDQRLLVRVIEDPDVVSGCLNESLASRGSKPADAWVCGQLSSLARAARSELPEDQPALFRSLAEAVMRLDPELRRALIRDKMLTEARHDDGLADVVRQMSIEEICSALVESLAEGEVSQEGLARAIRNLALISIAGRDDVIQAVGTAMRSSGVAEEQVSQVLGAAAPSRIEVRERPRPEEEEPIEKVLRLVDLAPSARQKDAAGDPGLEVLREEARRGITDGDVVATLVALVGLDLRADSFASTMSMLEDSLGMLVDRGDYEVAAEAAEGLAAALHNERLTDEQRRRVSTALNMLASPQQMRAVNKALRVFPKGGPEYEACRRLLTTLGRHALLPLLEVLAEESDMSARKSMVDLVAGMADDFIPELGQCVMDSRWYFVRNVVGILGRTHRPETLPYLERTLRHADARVRRETVRAVAGIHDRRSEGILIAALDDDDAQNVGVAARYLGTMGAMAAVPGLERVARGEARGSHDTGARVEAIEALGRLGASQALPTLKSLATRRGGLLRANRGQEVRAAATAAIAAINASAVARGADRS